MGREKAIWNPGGGPGDPEIISILQRLATMQINPPMTIVTIE
jgi:hypothetical protein